MTAACHCCGNDFEVWAFSHLCRRCYWGFPPAFIEKYMREYRKRGPQPSAARDAARGTPPTPSTITAGPDGRPRHHREHDKILDRLGPAG